MFGLTFAFRFGPAEREPRRSKKDLGRVYPFPGSIRLKGLMGLKRKDSKGDETVNFDDAQLFVQKMRADTGFRRSVIGFGASAELWDFLKRSGFEFDACDLVKAMAACMAETDQMP